MKSLAPSSSDSNLSLSFFLVKNKIFSVEFVKTPVIYMANTFTRMNI